jgi:hypothetical protein
VLAGAPRVRVDDHAAHIHRFASIDPSCTFPSSSTNDPLGGTTATTKANENATSQPITRVIGMAPASLDGERSIRLDPVMTHMLSSAP